MKKTFKAENINCNSCVNIIKNSLWQKFGAIEVDLDKKPVEVTVYIKNKGQEKNFKEQMESLGFAVIG
ncbi:MAG: heavy metal transport/detoxification protein [Gammaproteobacteria bacterium]|nr:MAG: heavy metal transport/detoxification protein [Gammaproteobacteria bacterium]